MFSMTVVVRYSAVGIVRITRVLQQYQHVFHDSSGKVQKDSLCCNSTVFSHDCGSGLFSGEEGGQDGPKYQDAMQLQTPQICQHAAANVSACSSRTKFDK